MARANPRALRVVTAYRSTAGPGWEKTLQQLGLEESEHWRNVRLEPEVERFLGAQLHFAGRSSLDVLVDPDGCVVHSDFAPQTLLPVLERALRDGERCREDDRSLSP
jgi:hypothetical protein